MLSLKAGLLFLKAGNNLLFIFYISCRGISYLKLAAAHINAKQLLMLLIKSCLNLQYAFFLYLSAILRVGIWLKCFLPQSSSVLKYLIPQSPFLSIIIFSAFSDCCLCFIFSSVDHVDFCLIVTAFMVYYSIFFLMIHTS